MSHVEDLRPEVREKVHAISAIILIDQAIDSANPDQIDRTTIPDEHAVPVAKYLSGLAIDRANTYLQLVRRSEAAGGISIPRSPQEDGYPIPDAGEIERLDVEAAKTHALKMLKRVVDYEGRNEDMEEQLAEHERETKRWKGKSHE